MQVSYCFMNLSWKTIPSKSGLSNGILRWQQEVCKWQCQIWKGAYIVFHYKTGSGLQPTVAAVPSIFCSPPLSFSLSHLSSSVLLMVYAFPNVFNSINNPRTLNVLGSQTLSFYCQPLLTINPPLAIQKYTASWGPPLLGFLSSYWEAVWATVMYLKSQGGVYRRDLIRAQETGRSSSKS